MRRQILTTMKNIKTKDIYFLKPYVLQIDGIFKLCDEFFQLDDAVKQKYARPADGSGHGWVANEREK